MINKLLIIVIIFSFSSCSLDKVVKHHGVHLLEKKQKKIEVFSNNLNDVRILLGPPSTKNSFDTFDGLSKNSCFFWHISFDLCVKKEFTIMSLHFQYFFI